MQGFKEFILRGNVVGLAVAVVIGAAFSKIVDAVVSDVITPLIAFALPSSFQSLKTASVSSAPHVFVWGDLVYSVINFVAVAAVLYFLVVRPMAHLEARRAAPAAAPTTRPCPECISDIPTAARRCPFCTAEVPPAAAAL